MVGQLLVVAPQMWHQDLCLVPATVHRENTWSLPCGTKCFACVPIQVQNCPAPQRF